MSNPLEQYKQDLATERGKQYLKMVAGKEVSETILTSSFEKGCDAILALDLPVKFLVHLAQEEPDALYKYGQDEDGGESAFRDHYQYWINNVYKPE